MITTHKHNLYSLYFPIPYFVLLVKPYKRGKIKPWLTYIEVTPYKSKRLYREPFHDVGFVMWNLKDKEFTLKLSSASRWYLRFTFHVTMIVCSGARSNTFSSLFFSITLTQRGLDKSRESHECHALDSLQSTSCDNESDCTCVTLISRCLHSKTNIKKEVFVSSWSFFIKSTIGQQI